MPRIFITAMVIGFGALIWVLYSLALIIKVERTEALLNLKHKQVDINYRVNAQFEKLVNGFKNNSRHIVTAALADPLIDDKDLFYFSHGRLVLPRLYSNKQFRQNAVALFRQLNQLNYTFLRTNIDLVWKKRIHLYQQFIANLEQENVKQMVIGFNKIMLHRQRYIIDARKDLPYMLALIKNLVSKGKPEAQLIRNLLIKGPADNVSFLNLGMQRLLIEKKNKFSEKEFMFFADVVIQLSKQHQLPVQRFSQRILKDVIKLPKVNSHTAMTYVSNGAWLITLNDGTDIVALHRPIEKTVGLIQMEFQKSGALHVDDELLLTASIVKQMHINKIKLVIKSQEREIQSQVLHSRYGYKLLLIIACGVFALAMIILAALHQYRKLAYLKLQSEFLAAVSHELRTPLTSIRLLAETLEYRLEGVEEARDYPSRIVNDIDGLTFLVENILSYNRLQKDFWNLKKLPLDLSELVSKIKNEMHLHASKVVNIHFENDASVKIEADAELIKLLIINLVKNSCYYNANQEVTIHISLLTQNNKGVIKYKDNGIGISADEWKKVFSDFYRITKQHSNNIRGSGLGLAICKKVMQLHKGKIWIAHSSEQGTEFNIQF